MNSGICLRKETLAEMADVNIQKKDYVLLSFVKTQFLDEMLLANFHLISLKDVQYLECLKTHYANFVKHGKSKTCLKFSAKAPTSISGRVLKK